MHQSRYSLILQHVFPATDVRMWIIKNTANIISLRGVKGWVRILQKRHRPEHDE